MLLSFLSFYETPLAGCLIPALRKPIRPDLHGISQLSQCKMPNGLCDVLTVDNGCKIWPSGRGVPMDAGID
jgi:hypothetical protein